MKIFAAASAGISGMLITGAVWAQGATVCFVGSKMVPCSDVPEISALEGTAAVAALAAVVLLVWERRRRAA